MEGSNCDGKGGWMRVAYLNMSEPGATCPPGLNYISIITLIMVYVVNQRHYLVIKLQYFSPHTELHITKYVDK